MTGSHEGCPDGCSAVGRKTGSGLDGSYFRSPALQLGASLVEAVVPTVLWKQGGSERDDAYQRPLKASRSPQSRLLANLHCSTVGPDTGHGERITTLRESFQELMPPLLRGLEKVVTSCGRNFLEPMPDDKRSALHARAP